MSKFRARADDNYARPGFIAQVARALVGIITGGEDFGELSLTTIKLFFTNTARRFGLQDYVKKVRWVAISTGTSISLLASAGEDPNPRDAGNPRDWFGDFYIKKLSKATRQEGGVVNTPQWLARKMVGDSLALVDRTFHSLSQSRSHKPPLLHALDPCCGTGIFLLELLAALYTTGNVSTDSPDHVLDCLSQVAGQDRDPVACFLATLNIFIWVASANKKAVPAIMASPDLIQVCCADFLLEDIQSRDDNSGVNTICKLPKETANLILGNPPYIFLRNLSPGEKDALKAWYHTSLQQFDVYGVFLEHAVAILPPAGIVAFVVPDSILTLPNRRRTRKFLLTHTHVMKICFVGTPFPGAVVSSVVISAKKVRTPRALEEAVVEIEPWQNLLSMQNEPFGVYNFARRLPQALFVGAGYSFGSAVEGATELIGNLLKKYAMSIEDYNLTVLPEEQVLLGRGIEIGKKGLVSRCTQCEIYFPTPRRAICSLCGASLAAPVTMFPTSDFAGEEAAQPLVPVVLGVTRWEYHHVRQVITGLPGIKYKDGAIYSPRRIIIRQLLQKRLLCAAIPPANALTTQSVYNLNLPEVIDLRACLGVINSQIAALVAHQIFSGGKKLFPRVLLYILSELPLIPRQVPNSPSKDLLCDLVGQFLNTPSLDGDDHMQDKLNEAVLSYFGCSPEDTDHIRKAIRQFRAEVLRNENLYTKT